jgi:hypothetical protein
MAPSGGFSPAQLNQITRMIEQAFQSFIQDRSTLTNPQGPPGTQGPQGERGAQRERSPPGTTVSSSRFSPKEIGFFSPRLDERDGQGDIVQIGSETYIRNVYYFIDRIKDTVRLRGEDEVKANLIQYLRGAAIEWYTDTLTNFEKEALRTGSITLWYDRLENKWKEPTAVAVKQVLSAKYTLVDAAADKDIAAHIRHVMRHTKPANISDRYAQLSMVYSSIHPILRGLIPTPTPDTTVDSFIRACEAQQEIWRETARFYLPKQSKQVPSQLARQTPQSTRTQYSARRYNDLQPLYAQDAPIFGYRGHPSAAGYRQPTDYRGAYPISDYGNQPARPPLPLTRQPLQITNGSSSNRPSADSRPYGTNPSSGPPSQSEK